MYSHAVIDNAHKIQNIDNTTKGTSKLYKLRATCKGASMLAIQRKECIMKLQIPNFWNKKVKSNS